MGIAESSIEGLKVTAIDGRIDSATAGDYETKLLDLLQDGRTAMVLDLAAVDYLSSAGIRVLLLLFKRAAALKLALAIARPQEHVAEILAIAGLDDVMPPQPSIAAAIQAVRAA
jgi:anti-anti-sigma factor